MTAFMQFWPQTLEKAVKPWKNGHHWNKGLHAVLALTLEINSGHLWNKGPHAILGWASVSLICTVKSSIETLE
jgi:hypothetical protein